MTTHSVRHASRHWTGFGRFARHAPHVSGASIMLVGIYVGAHGLRAIL